MCGEMGRRVNEASYRHHSVVREQQGLSRATKMNAFGKSVRVCFYFVEKKCKNVISSAVARNPETERQKLRHTVLASYKQNPMRQRNY